MQNKPAPPRRRGEKKLLIGITGGIGSGKTLASKYFESLGYKVIYADSAAKQLYRTNKILKQKLVREFGKGILDDKGNISGLAARKIMLSNRRNIKRVNMIVHPFVVKEIAGVINKIKDKIVFVEAAIMFDSGYYKRMDYTLLVYTPKDLRVKRVSDRDKIPAKEVKRLINLQMDERDKVKIADFVIRNDGSKQILYKRLDTFHNFVQNYLKKSI